MGQVAYDASNGELIEAFSATDEQWAVISAAARGSMLMPGSAWPAVPKTSIRGLRFFAHHPRYPGPLARALVHENMEYYSQYGEHQADAEDLLLLGVPLEGKDTYPEERPFIRFSRGPQIRRMPMSEAIQGVLNGVPQWRRPSWYWGLPASPTTAD